MLSASGNLFECHEEVLYLQPLIPPKRFDIFPPITGGCAEDLGVLRFFFKKRTLPVLLSHGASTKRSATVHPQHDTSTKRVKRTLPVLTVARREYKRGAMIQPQHGTSTKRAKGTLPVLTVARREYKTRCNGTATARHECKTGKTYITRADCAIVYARHEYKNG